MLVLNIFLAICLMLVGGLLVALHFRLQNFLQISQKTPALSKSLSVSIVQAKNEMSSMLAKMDQVNPNLDSNLSEARKLLNEMDYMMDRASKLLDELDSKGKLIKPTVAKVVPLQGRVKVEDRGDIVEKISPSKDSFNEPLNIKTLKSKKPKMSQDASKTPVVTEGELQLMKALEGRF